jgi:hypothetical protein
MLAAEKQGDLDALTSTAAIWRSSRERPARTNGANSKSGRGLRRQMLRRRTAPRYISSIGT